MRQFKILLSVVLVLVFSNICFADNFNAPGPGGVYFGTGNSDGDFTTTVAGNADSHIYLSLRGTIAFGALIAPSPAGEYDCTVAGCSFQYSVYTDGAFNIGDFAFSLTINDLTSGKSFTYDPSGKTVPIDNSYWFSTAGRIDAKDVPTGTLGNAVGFQNSERFIFFNDPTVVGSVANEIGYSPTDEVMVTLSAENVTDPSVTIGFNAAPVPEPSAIILTLTIAGLVGFRARRRQKA